MRVIVGLLILLCATSWGQLPRRVVQDMKRATSQPVGTDITTGLVAWWKLDEVAGGSGADSCGTNTLTVLYPAWTNALWGNGIYVNPDNYSYAKAKWSSAFSVTNLTVSLWKYSFVKSNPAYLFSGDSSSASSYNPPYMIFESGEQLTFRVTTGTGVSTNIFASNLNNAWQHLAMTYDGSTFSAYTNGILAATTKSPTITAVGTNVGGIFFNAYGQDGGAFYKYMIGVIDDCRFYNRALNAASIAALYNEP